MTVLSVSLHCVQGRLQVKAVLKAGYHLEALTKMCPE